MKPEVRRLGGIGRDSPFFDPAAFTPVTAVRFGSSGRNILRGPGFVNADLGLFRNFAFSERSGMQFRAEEFNFTNTPKFSNPSANVSGGGVHDDDQRARSQRRRRGRGTGYPVRPPLQLLSSNLVSKRLFADAAGLQGVDDSRVAQLKGV